MCDCAKLDTFGSRERKNIRSTSSRYICLLQLSKSEKIGDMESSSLCGNSHASFDEP